MDSREHRSGIDCGAGTAASNSAVYNVAKASLISLIDYFARKLR